MKRRIWHAALLAGVLCARAHAADEKLLVTLTSVPKTKRPEAAEQTLSGLAEGYGIRCRAYHVKNYKDGFTADLGKAGLLSIGSRYEWRSMLNDPAVIESFKGFMARGGVMLMQYKTIPGTHVPEFRDKFYSLPEDFYEEYQSYLRNHLCTVAGEVFNKG